MSSAYDRIMRLELKTENDQFSKSYLSVFLILIFLSLIIILLNISFKLGNISRHYQFQYLCKLLIIEKSPSNFNKLSKLSNLTNKQKIWDLCREIIN